MMHDFERDGLQLFTNACSPAELARIEALLTDISPEAAGSRLHNRPDLIEWLGTEGIVGRVASKLMGESAIAVRVILFDKNDTNNWSLGWHQDRTIVVKERIKTEGFGPWTTKAGLQHVAPPIAVLQAMVTLRLHIDPVPADNAPLLVAAGSHRLGRIAEADISGIVQRCGIVECLAQRGDIWAYSTPILHASHASLHPGRRRVLQVDYAANDLPGGLKWRGLE